MAATEREHVLKIQGGYHGTHDTVEVGVEGEGREHLGIPSDVESRVHTVPFNNTEALKTTFEERGEDLACFIVEPVLGVGGMIPATTDYLSTARDLTEAYGVVLIFDEVMTFRLAEGGAQERYGVTPDLTALGKLIGGGLPVGAFGGRTDLMEGFHPEDGSVNHSGTFNANPATMAGGCATLDALDQTAINRLNEMGDQLRINLEAAAEGTDIPVQITGDGSLFQIHFTDDSIVDLASSTAGEAMEPLFLGMRTEGIFLAPRGMGNLSTPMGEPEINRFVEAFERVLTQLSSE
jgi:glutamate-1-semialdehyde 2,1-aminomutase